jgi:CARDB
MIGRARLAMPVLLAAAVALTCAAAGTAVATAAEPGAASVALLECSTGKTRAQRWALFRGEMDQIPEATRMRMRFDLFEKVGTSPWRGVGPYAVGDWHESKPGIRRYAYRQRVVGLKPATRYRVSVSFNWLDDAGSVVAERSARSAACRQRGKLPNLAFRGAVEGGAGPSPGTYRYAVRIRNDGVVAAPRSALKLVVDGAEVDVRPIGRLPSGARRTIRFVGPVCAGRIFARLDPEDVVREIAEQDNRLIQRCPRSR